MIRRSEGWDQRPRCQRGLVKGRGYTHLRVRTYTEVRRTDALHDDRRRTTPILFLGRGSFETVVHREEREFQAVCDAKLVEDVREMVLDRLHADCILLRDFAVG